MFIAIEAIETDKRCLKVAGKRFIFGPSSINHFPCKINFSLDPSLKFKNCTLEGALFRPRIYGNPADCANRPNFSGSGPLVYRTHTRPGFRSRLKIDVHSPLGILISNNS